MRERGNMLQELIHAVKDALKRRWLDGEFLATHFNEATSLDLSSMKWGDAEMTKLATALAYCHAKGALPKLEQLSLRENAIGDVGMQALAEAVSKGALPQLKEANVYLGGNPGNAELVKGVLRERKGSK